MQKSKRAHPVSFVLLMLIATLMLGALGTASAAEQWGWTAEIRRGTQVIATDPTVYATQSEAAAAMRQLQPPVSQFLTQTSPGHGSPGNGSIEIQYTAPTVPSTLGETTYTNGVDPTLFGLPPQIFNPLDVSDEADLADAINSWWKTNGSPACSSQDRGVIIEDTLWGGFILTGSPSVANKSYSITPWTSSAAQPNNCFVSDDQFPFDDGRVFSNVYRIRLETCPTGYRLTSQNADGVGACDIVERGVVRGTPHQCEVTPISTLVGNPCDAITGAKTETVSDYSSDTVHVTRSYNSHSQVGQSFGPGWMHNYDQRLSISAAFGSFRSPSMLLRPNGVTTLLNGISVSGVAVWQSTSGNGLLVRRDGTNYRAFLRSGATELYDIDGFLIELVDAAGRTTSIERDGNNRVTSVVGPFGKMLTFEYDSEQRLVSIIDPSGNAIDYAYGANNELIAVTYQDDSSVQYHYEDPAFPFHLTGVTDENGDRFSTFAYDSIGRTIVSEHAGGFERIELEYFPTQTVVRDAAGNTRTFQFTTDTSRLRKLNAVFEQDATTTIVTPSYNSDRQRRPTEFIDPNGVTTRFVYDGFHLTQLTEGAGTPDERSTLYEYLSTDSDLVTRKTTPSVFSGGVREVITDYGDDNLPDSITVSGFTPAGDPVVRTTNMTYSPSGQIATIDGPRSDVNDTTVFSYYECDTGFECGQLQSAVNPLGHTTTYDRYDAHGTLLEGTDRNGKTTIQTYDLRNRVTSILQLSPEGVEYLTSFTYDLAGQPVLTTLPDGTTITNEYNAAHLLTETRDGRGNRIAFEYDSKGNRIGERVFDPDGELRRETLSAYDIRNALASVTEGGFTTTQTVDASGNLIEVTDPLQATTSHEYDSLNRAFRRVDVLLGETLWEYDVNGRKTKTVASNGTETIHGYDDLGNLIRELSPDRGETLYQYDAAGNQTSKTDARGVTQTTVYDALSRVISRTTDGGDLEQFEYDASPNGVGHLTKLTDSSGVTEWQFNAFGDELSRTQTAGPISLAGSRTYDSAGRLTSLTYPSGRVVSYAYDLDQITEVSVDGVPLLSNASYEPFGPVNRWTWVDATTSNRTYDQRGLISAHSLASDVRTLGYDAAKRLTSQADSRQTLGFEYDLLGRLTNATGEASGTVQQGFSDTPVLLTTIQTMNNEIGAVPSEPSAPWLTVATKNVTAGGAKVALERGQVNTGSIDVKEKIGYLAIETTTGSLLDSAGNSIAYESQITPEIIRGWGTGCFDTAFANTYAVKPVVMASLDTHNGGDGGWLRRCKLNKTTLGLTVDEDRFGDPERRHNNAEGAGVVAFSAAFDAQFADENGNWGMEIAKVTLPSTATAPVFTSITFRQAYATRPVVLVLPNKSGGNPASIRIRNVTKTGFEVVQVEPAPENGTHSSMPIHYLAIEAGNHSLPDGTRLVVGRKATKKQKHGSGVTGQEGWASIIFADDVAPPSGDTTFTYDANGNRVSIVDGAALTDYSYSPLTNRLASITGPTARTYQYDEAGNIVSDGTDTFTYSGDGRLIAVEGGIAAYDHNGLGQRVSKNTADSRIFFWGNDGLLLGEYDSAGNEIVEHVYLWGMPVAALTPSQDYLVHTDHLGSPRVLTADGSVVWRWDSKPFGDNEAETDPDGDGADVDYFLRMPGQYYDSETALHYNYYRTYDPAIGRYRESDPIGLVGGTNTYAYVGSNPLGLIDPFGLLELSAEFTGGKNAGATVVCRDGQFAVHVFEQNSNPCIDNCAREHEKAHIEQFKQRSAGLCRGVKFSWLREPNPRLLEQQEASAYWTELKCLEDEDENACDDDECSTERDERIEFVKNRLGFFR